MRLFFNLLNNIIIRKNNKLNITYILPMIIVLITILLIYSRTIQIRLEKSIKKYTNYKVYLFDRLFLNE